jgi:hypothetical protein
LPFPSLPPQCFHSNQGLTHAGQISYLSATSPVSEIFFFISNQIMVGSGGLFFTKFRTISAIIISDILFQIFHSPSLVIPVHNYL